MRTRFTGITLCVIFPLKANRKVALSAEDKQNVINVNYFSRSMLTHSIILPCWLSPEVWRAWQAAWASSDAVGPRGEFGLERYAAATGSARRQTYLFPRVGEAGVMRSLYPHLPFHLSPSMDIMGAHKGRYAMPIVKP